MVKFIAYVSLAILAVGMLLLPLAFGSAAGAASLVVALLWLLVMVWQKSTWAELPLFQKIWLACGIAAFPILAMPSTSPADFVHGLNTFAFVLAIGVFAFAHRYIEPRLLRFLAFIALLGLAVGVGWALYQRYEVGVGRTTAYMGGGSNLIARIGMLLALFAYVPLYLPRRKIWHWLLALCSLGAALVVIFYSGSRGAVLVVPLLLVLPLLFLMPARFVASVPAWTISILAIVGIVAIGLYFAPSRLVSLTLVRVQSVLMGQGMDASTSIRFEMWQVAFATLKANPLLGVGWHGFVQATEGYPLHDYALIDRFFSFHSDLGNFAVAGGILGLALYGLLLLAPLLFWRTPKTHPFFRVRLVWAVCLPIIYLAMGLTDMVIGFDYPTMFYAFSFALLWGATHQRENQSA